MYTVSDRLIQVLADELLSRIGRNDYYSGSFDFEFEDICCQMVLSAVVYRDYYEDFEGSGYCVSDLSPVWWEFHTYDEEGDEILNDFSFNYLREHIQSMA